MAATDSIMYSLERIWEMVEAAISDLDYETMARQPNAHSNSIAWIFGHISRVTDMFIMHRLQSKPELWLTKGWCERFGLADNVEGLGRGADLATWKPPEKRGAGSLLRGREGYYQGIRATPVLRGFGEAGRVPSHSAAAGAHPWHRPRPIGAGECRPRRPDRLPEGIPQGYWLVPVGPWP